jgi:hypothetical protein
MSRQVQITAPAELTDPLLKKLTQLDGILSVSVQRGVSVRPPGDVITVLATAEPVLELKRFLQSSGWTDRADLVVITTEPLSASCSPERSRIAADNSEATWEEMDQTMAKESNMTANGLFLMAAAGLLAAAGISTDSLHIVIGAMVIAPGFEPITRIALGLAAGGNSTRRGAIDTLKGYAVLVLAAAGTAWLLQRLGYPPLGGKETYLPEKSLVSFWTSFSAPGLMTSFIASIAGAVLIAANRSVLTAGVMIALALVPTAALAGMALVVGDTHTAGLATARWLIEFGAVAMFSFLVFAWKRRTKHRRRSLA